MPKRYKEERRRYIRLDSVFPIEFKFRDLESKEISRWLQGFTNNISKGGVCLTVNNLSKELEEALKKKDEIKISLNIHVPLSKKAVSASGRIAWFERTKEYPINQYLIGIDYTKIDERENKRIFYYAQTKKILPNLILSLILILILGLGMNSFYNLKLRRQNLKLVEELVEILQKSSLTKEEIQKIKEEKEDLEQRLAQEKFQIESLEEKLKELVQREEVLRKEDLQRIEGLKEELAKVSKDKESLEERLALLSKKEDTITQGLSQIKKERKRLEEETIRKMYEWIKRRQNPRTGLVLSFEGDTELEDIAFSYDQALASLVFLIFGDLERTKKIFNFYSKAKKAKGGFCNAYYASTGEPAEYVVHTGPNLWLGIAILKYTFITKDRTYLKVALGIADWAIFLQSQDPERGLKGGPDIEWFSTEHNLDAYAFFKMLYEVTKEDRYLLACQDVLSWLDKHVYDRQISPPVKRGRGDSTIATDTYAWSIAAIGPEKLKQIGMSPDEIIEFAEENCLVTTYFKRPTGEVISVRGFDFAKRRHFPRGGVISCEWTAQMVLSYKIISDYYKELGEILKADEYLERAEDFLIELGKLIISSPSPTGQGQGCLPYATQDFVDTGHGWYTPKGSRTGALSSTAYTILAYRGHNPLGLER